MNFEKELQAALEASEIATKIINSFYKTNYQIEIKDDDSPVTIADKTADEAIRAHLSKLFPNYAFLTEEGKDDLARLNNDFVWIVDPLDGTKDFIAADDEFTCNIALAYKHEAVVGVVSVPAKNEYYYAAKGIGAFVRKADDTIKKIHVNENTENLTCYLSVFHNDQNVMDMIEKHKDKITVAKKIGSSIKACLIAEGIGEITYRLSNGTKEWDTAAFQAIVEQAGGLVLLPNKERMMYNKEDVYNRDGYLVINRIENFLL